MPSVIFAVLSAASRPVGVFLAACDDGLRGGIDAVGEMGCTGRILNGIITEQSESSTRYTSGPELDLNHHIVSEL